MIPKKIHYCWFSTDKKPYLVRKCLKSWKNVLKDYEIICWDANSFNFDSVPFVKQAIEAKKWAFAADYIRLYALYHHGGIYLDSDIEVIKNFDKFLDNAFFAGTDKRNPEGTHFAIEAAIMGATPGNEYVRECMKYYENRDFIDSEGNINCQIMPDVMAPILEPYGYVAQNKTQHLDKNYTIYSTDYFTNSLTTIDRTKVFAHHWNNASWCDFPERGKLYHYCRKHDLMHYYKIIEMLLSAFRKN